MFEYGQVPFPAHIHSPDSLHAARLLPLRDDDVFLVTYPKSGTTWLQELISVVLAEGDPGPALVAPTWERAPWLEQRGSIETIMARTSPRVITTHLHRHLAPEGLSKGQGKVVYLARNPKDVVVSSFHFHHIALFLEESGSWEDFFQRFLDGKTMHGSWFEHVLGWLKSDENSNLLLLTYEELHTEFRTSLRRLASFLGRPLDSAAEEMVSSHCSFAKMVTNCMTNYSLVPHSWINHTQGRFLRKGVLGDWKTHLTINQNDKIECEFQERFTTWSDAKSFGARIRLEG
uniref:Sulfotransferase n=1 Tax=Eptatretus burgeri TaxID=7764 RepID=A0A8C4QLT4_EPTBU